MMNGCVSCEALQLTRSEDAGQDRGKSCSTDPVDVFSMQERMMDLD